MNRKENNKSNSQSYSNKINLVKNIILGVGVTNEKEKSILEYVINSLENSSDIYYIVTPNPEILVYGQRQKEFQNILNQARIALCDGVGLSIAGRVLGKPFKERITGVDFTQELCKKVARKPITVGFLGGRHRVAEMTADCLQRKYPGLKVAFAAEEWDDNYSDSPKKYIVSSIKYLAKKKEIPNTKYQILNTSIDILFVAFGFPKQEMWMAEHINKVNVRVMVGVGGAFDYINGRVARAPGWVRRIGFEWLYRLLREPWRIKRQLALIEFIGLIVNEKFISSPVQ